MSDCKHIGYDGFFGLCWDCGENLEAQEQS